MAQYLLGNLIWMPYGYIVDVGKMYTYKQTQINANLEEIPRHNTATGGAPTQIALLIQVDLLIMKLLMWLMW